MQSRKRTSIVSLLIYLLDAAWYGALIGLVLAACLMVLSALTDLSNASMDIPVSFGISAPAIHVEGASPTTVAEFERARGTGTLKVTPPPNRAFLLSAAASLFIGLTLVAWILKQLRAVFRTLRDGRPFVTANAARIRGIGIAIMAGALGEWALWVAGGRLAPFHLSANGIDFAVSPQLNLTAVFAGLLIVAIAEAFREGTRLDEEQSLTI